MAISFEDSTIPTRTYTRAKKGNPFTGMFPLPQGVSKKAVFPITRTDTRTIRKGVNEGQTVPVLYTQIDGVEVALHTLVNEAQAAGREVSATTACRLNDNGDNTATLVVWTKYNEDGTVKLQRKNAE